MAIIDRDRYREAGAMLRHDSLLRRTTMGFAFALTAISLGTVSKATNEWIVMIPIVNLAALFLFYIQDQYLSKSQSKYSTFLEDQEKKVNGHAGGPYTIHSKLREMRLATDNYTFLVYLLLYFFWAGVLLIPPCDQITLWPICSINLWGFAVLVVIIALALMIWIKIRPRIEACCSKKG